MSAGPVRKLISGGQSGVDRAALDVGLELDYEVGGWCPAGRWAEDGEIDERYPLRETPSAEPSQRTEWNIRDCDGCLILSPDPLAGGTAYTEMLARESGKPLLVVDPWQGDRDRAREWLARSGVGVLNVAGPRESQRPGIYDAAVEFLRSLLGR